ncbi:MAG: DUF2125 domain-containing protein, partial [Pseudomonadota bacterium]
MRRIARIMGRIGAICLLGAVLWLAGAIATERALEAAMASLRRAGWQVEAGAMATSGFPAELDTEV